MALDSALHFLDELKDKYIHEVEKAIEDWDYQDFSPDKRTPLLENEIVNDVPADDLQPEINALQQIKSAQELDWSGLSRDEMLAEQAYGVSAPANTSAMTYEARVVCMATPPGGVQGMPDADSLQRFMRYTQVMVPSLVADAFATRLQQTVWQVRSKALVLMEVLLESVDFSAVYLPEFSKHPLLLALVDKIRTQDHNPIARENARKVLSLLRSNGRDANMIAREHVTPKPHVHHVATAKPKTKPAVEKPKLVVKTAVTTKSPSTHQYHVTSPKIAAAALASWRRRSQKELLNSTSPRAASPVKTMAPPPAPVSPSSRTGSIKKSGSVRSSFTFMNQAPTPQSGVAITASSRSQFYLPVLPLGAGG